MPDISIDERTHEKLVFTARLMDRTVGDVVKQLVDKLAAEPRLPLQASTDDEPVASRVVEAEPSPEPRRSSPWIPVHKVFKGKQYQGRFNPSTMELMIETVPWSGQIFSSPTAAAQAVVGRTPSERQTVSTNGRKFWRVTSTGKNLRSVVGQRY
jgi:hypothetical protein